MKRLISDEGVSDSEEAANPHDADDNSESSGSEEEATTAAASSAKTSPEDSVKPQQQQRAVSGNAAGGKAVTAESVNTNLLIAEIVCDLADFSVALASKIAAKTGYQWRPKRAKVVAVAKDPTAPKKPQGAYFLFCDSMRKRLKETHPDQPALAPAKLSELWKTLAPETRAKFENLARTQKEAYAKALKEHTDHTA